MLLNSVIIPTIMLANKQSTYYRYGPSEDLIIISIKINTWTRYFILLAYIMAIRVCKVFVSELGMPILSFNIYNPNQKKSRRIYTKLIANSSKYNVYDEFHYLRIYFAISNYSTRYSNHIMYIFGISIHTNNIYFIKK